MTPRKPKPPPQPVSQYHPLKIACVECGAEPFLLCRESGAIWSDGLRWCHVSRMEACMLEMVFE